MKIDETRVFNFRMPFVGGLELGFPVMASSQQEAASTLKEWFGKAQMELALMFPEVQATEALPVTLNALQVGLIDDLASACNLDNKNLPKSIKDATGLELTLENFKLIVPKLEQLRDTGKVTFPENGKKK